jgi:hypothetical protein
VSPNGVAPAEQLLLQVEALPGDLEQLVGVGVEVRRERLPAVQPRSIPSCAARTLCHGRRRP